MWYLTYNSCLAEILEDGMFNLFNVSPFTFYRCSPYRGMSVPRYAILNLTHPQMLVGKKQSSSIAEGDWLADNLASGSKVLVSEPNSRRNNVNNNNGSFRGGRGSGYRPNTQNPANNRGRGRGLIPVEAASSHSSPREGNGPNVKGQFNGMARGRGNFAHHRGASRGRGQ